MRDYIILNGVNSNTITGLLISTLPPITKPKIRTQTEEIDGRDGDIVTKLGYSAYDKELEIGLYGNFDIDDVIAYFNSEGTVTFSNEPDKFYNYQILDQIDYEKLIRFKKAKVKMHVQPFKYPLEETPVEITNQYVNNEAEEMDLDNTKEAPMTIDLKGNTSQYTTTGKNLLINIRDEGYTVTSNGITFKVNADKSITITGTATNVASMSLNTSTPVTLTAGTYTLSKKETTDVQVAIWYDASSVFTSVRGTNNTIQKTLSQDTTYNNWRTIVVVYQGVTVNTTVYPMLEKSSTETSYEPYTNGASPNPDYPQNIQVVSGDNSINVCGKNLAKENIISNGRYNFLLDSIELEANKTYTFSFIPTNNNIGFNIKLNSSGGTIIKQYQTATKDQRYTTTITLNENGKLFINNYTNGFYAKDIMIEQNNQATTYEPYIGNTYPINLPVENLFELPTTQTINGITFTNNGNGTFNLSGTASAITDFAISKELSTIANGKFTMSSKSTGYSSMLAFYNGNTWLSTPINKLPTELIKTSNITIPSNATRYDLVIRVPSGYTVNLINETVQFEKGSKANSYTPYGTTPIELCKIGNYQDYIYKDSNKWYLHKEIGKVVLDGTNNTFTGKSGTANVLLITGTITNIKRPPNNNSLSTIYCNIGKSTYTPNQLYSNSYIGTTIRVDGTIAIGFGLNNSQNITDVASGNSWLTTNNVSLYFPLATPTTTEITDETLIAQLNALANASSYDTVTHITQNENDKPFILNATALQQGSGEATVNNEGNIYSKPTLDIEGSGTVGIYLDGNQIFSIDLSNSSECVIDTTQLEAYNPTTSELMNRQVTGDYSNFKLDAGDNQVQATGEITKVTISNYTRWL